MKLSHVPVGLLVMFGVLQGCGSSAPEEGQEESSQSDLSLPADPNRCANGGLKPRCEVFGTLDCKKTRACYNKWCTSFSFGRGSVQVSKCQRCPTGTSDIREELPECEHAEPAPH
jgi:hypothetical protein